LALGGAAGQELVKRTPCRVEIGAERRKASPRPAPATGSRLLERLTSPVEERPPSCRPGRPALPSPEAGELDLGRRSGETRTVVGFKSAVDDPPLVELAQALQDPLEGGERLGDRRAPASPEDVGERRAVPGLVHQVDPAVVFAARHHPEEVRVGRSAAIRSNLAVEALPPPRDRRRGARDITSTTTALPSGAVAG